MGTPLPRECSTTELLQRRALFCPFPGFRQPGNLAGSCMSGQNIAGTGAAEWPTSGPRRSSHVPAVACAANRSGVLSRHEPRREHRPTATRAQTGRRGVWPSLPRLERGDRWFESSRPDHPLSTATRVASRCVAQPDRASDPESEGREFNSRRSVHPASFSGRTPEFDSGNRGSNP